MPPAVPAAAAVDATDATIAPVPSYSFAVFKEATCIAVTESATVSRFLRG